MKDCHKDYNYKILRKCNIKQIRLKIPPMAIPRSTQRSAVWPAAIRMLEKCASGYKAREKTLIAKCLLAGKDL